MTKLENKAYQVEIEFKNITEKELTKHLNEVFDNQEEYIKEGNKITALIVVPYSKDVDYHEGLMSAIAYTMGTNGECLDYFELV